MLEASDISQIVQELIRLHDDQRSMMAEDERSLHLREIYRLQCANQVLMKQFEKMREKYKSLRSHFESAIAKMDFHESHARQDSTSDTNTNVDEKCLEIGIVEALPPEAIPRAVLLANPAGGTVSVAAWSQQGFIADTKKVTSSSHAIFKEGGQRVLNYSLKRHATTMAIGSDSTGGHALDKKRRYHSVHEGYGSDSKENSTICNAVNMPKSIQDRTSRPEMKVVEVVRNKAAREALPGHQCTECSKYYDALLHQGVITETSMAEILRQCSRHKHKWTPPTTPHGFWDLSVGTPDDWKSKAPH